jgi:hypothetical protein
VQHETNRYIWQRNKPKRKYRKYQRLEAHDAVYIDYFHPEQPTFEDKEFQQIFRVSKTIFEQLLQTCCNPLQTLYGLLLLGETWHGCLCLRYTEGRWSGRQVNHVNW